MHRLGLEVNRPAPCRAKMANNVKVRCVGIVNAVKVKAFDTEEVDVDIFVIIIKPPPKREGSHTRKRERGKKLNTSSLALPLKLETFMSLT